MNISPWPVVCLSGAATLILTLWISSRPEATPSHPLPAAVPNSRLHASVSGRSPAALEGESRVEFAPRMPMGRGVAVVDSSGRLVGDAVLVAVPDAFGQLQYLPRTDPRAVRYEKQQQAEHQRAIEDNGPRQVNLGSITMKNSVTARGRSVPIAVKP